MRQKARGLVKIGVFPRRVCAVIDAVTSMTDHFICWYIVNVYNRPSSLKSHMEGQVITPADPCILQGGKGLIETSKLKLLFLLQHPAAV